MNYALSRPIMKIIFVLNAVSVQEKILVITVDAARTVQKPTIVSMEFALMIRTGTIMYAVNAETVLKKMNSVSTASVAKTVGNTANMMYARNRETGTIITVKNAVIVSKKAAMRVKTAEQP